MKVKKWLIKLVKELKVWFWIWDMWNVKKHFSIVLVVIKFYYWNLGVFYFVIYFYIEI